MFGLGFELGLWFELGLGLGLGKFWNYDKG